MIMNNFTGNQTTGKPPQKKIKIMYMLLGDSDTFPLEARIFNCITLLGALTGYITVVTNILFHLPVTQQIASVGTSISGSILYYFSRVLKKWRAVVLPTLLLILILIMIILNWFFSEGIEGATGFYFFIISVGGLILLGEKYKIWPLLLILAVVVALSVIAAIKPGLITAYPDKLQKTSDILIGLIVALVITGLMVFLVFKEFLQERAGKDRLLVEITREKDTVKKTLQDKQRLLSMVCHDIANALLVIRCSVSQEQKKIATSGGTYLQRVNFAAINIAEIIDSVRMMEAIETGRFEFLLEPVDTAAVIEKARILFANRLAEKNIALKVTPSEYLPVNVLAEAKTLANNVFNNILSNAIKFSFPGATIAISLACKENETAISIRDSGIGIPVELCRDLFKPGVRTSRAGTSGETGTGFGLLVVNTFMQLYGGRIEIESKSIEEYPREHGTNVTLVLQNHQ
jgi:signal transduction histidine kinase